MTRRSKISLLALTAILAAGTLLWMRALASWRPQKVALLPKGYDPQYIDKSGNYVTAVNMGATKPEEMGGFESFDLKTGQSKKWAPTKQAGDSPDPDLSWGWVKGRELLWFMSSANSQVPGNASLNLRDAATGEFKHTLPWGSREYDLSLDMDVADNTLRVLSRNDFREFDLTTNRLKRRVQLSYPFESGNQYYPHYAISPDGKTLYGCSGPQGRIWDAQSGKLLKKWIVDRKGLTDPLQFSPDSGVVIYISFPSPLRRNDTLCHFVDSTTGRVLWTNANSVTIDRLFNSNSQILLPKNNNSELRDVFTGRLYRQLPGPRQSDGEILRVTPDWIYTQNGLNEIVRWRAH